MSAEKMVTHCAGCRAPVPSPALGLPSNWSLTFQNAETKDLCARCARSYYNTTGALGFIGGGMSTTGILARAAAAAAAAAAAEKKKPAPAEEEKHAAAPGRCAACRKKVGLLGFACRCGGAFCAAHRYAESHGCDFDYKEHGRERIARENPVVVGPKVAKISTPTGK